MRRQQHSKKLWRKSAGFFFCCVLLTAYSASAAKVDFYRDVYPFLKSNCLVCHNKTTTKAGLDMETPESMRKGGDSGPAIVPGKSRESLIVQASLHQKDMEMPPANNKSGAIRLTSSEVSVLKSWIDQGAKTSVQQERQVVWQALAANVHPIYSVAMTKDGRYAVCGRANKLFLYDLTTRQFLGEIVDKTQKSDTATAHRALVESIAFSPDGTHLASGSYREVKIWREEKTPAATKPAKSSWKMVASTLTPDGTKLVGINSKGDLLVLDAERGKRIKRISKVAQEGIKLLQVSADSEMAAVLRADGALAVWLLKKGKQIAVQTGATNVEGLAWSSDNKFLVTADADKILRVWSMPSADSKELSLTKELKGATGKITALISGATPGTFITAGEDGKVRFWNVAKGKEKEIPAAGILQLVLSPDGHQLALGGSDGAIRVVDVQTGKPVCELRDRLSGNRQIAALEWAVAAQGLEQSFQNSEIARIEAQNKAMEELLKKAKDAVAAAKKILPDKNKAVKPAQDAKATAQKELDEIKALIAKAPDGKADAALEKRLKDAQEKLAPLDMAESTALAAVAAVESNLKDAENNIARITDTKAKNSTSLETIKAALETAKKASDKANADLTAARQAVTKSKVKPLALAFSADSQRIAAMFADGTLSVWAVASGVPVEQVDGAPVTTVALSHGSDGSFIASYPEGTVTTTATTPHWVLERVLGIGKEHELFADRVNAVRFSPDGKILATGGGEPSRSGDIILFDVAKGKVLKTWKEKHKDTVLSLDFSPDGKLLASGGADKIARVTDIATGEQVNLFEGHTHYVMGVTFRADGRVLASAGADGAVITWDMILGERKKKIEGWSKEVTSLQFIGASDQIVTSAGDNLVRIVNDEGREVRSISKLPDFMQSAASTANAKVVIGGGEDSVLHVWDGTNGKELAAFGAK